MGIPLVRCPECNAGLKSTSPTGFPEGQTLTCPKCQTMFAAEAPPVARATAVVTDDGDDRPRKRARAEFEDEEGDDDRPRKRRARVESDEDDRPRKRGKRSRADSEGRDGFQYSRSLVRVVVVTTLLVVLAVLSVMLYQKWQREKEQDKSAAPVPRFSPTKA